MTPPKLGFSPGEPKAQMMREVKGLLNDASMDWMCVLGHHHRRQRPKSVQGFHPELTTKLKVVAVCPPNSPKPCHPCKSLPLTTTTTFVGDRIGAPHSVVLPTKRAALATAEGANLQRHTQSGCTGILFSSETLSWECRPATTCRLPMSGTHPRPHHPGPDGTAPGLPACPHDEDDRHVP
jgi:hypothetical protein